MIYYDSQFLKHNQYKGYWYFMSINFDIEKETEVIKKQSIFVYVAIPKGHLYDQVKTEYITGIKLDPPIVLNFSGIMGHQWAIGFKYDTTEESKHKDIGMCDHRAKQLIDQIIEKA